MVSFLTIDKGREISNPLPHRNSREWFLYELLTSPFKKAGFEGEDFRTSGRNKKAGFNEEIGLLIFCPSSRMVVGTGKNTLKFNACFRRGV